MIGYAMLLIRPSTADEAWLLANMEWACRACWCSASVLWSLWQVKSALATCNKITRQTYLKGNLREQLSFILIGSIPGNPLAKCYVLDGTIPFIMLHHNSCNQSEMPWGLFQIEQIQLPWWNSKWCQTQLNWNLFARGSMVKCLSWKPHASRPPRLFTQTHVNKALDLTPETVALPTLMRRFHASKETDGVLIREIPNHHPQDYPLQVSFGGCNPFTLPANTPQKSFVYFPAG